MVKEYINPPQLFPSLQYGFSQMVTVVGGKTVYLSGQVAWDDSQQVVGVGDLRIQTWQALKNIETALRVAGGEITDVVSMRIYIVESVLDESRLVTETLNEYFPESQAPATTWIGVRALANNDFLIEIEVIAVIDE